MTTARVFLREWVCVFGPHPKTITDQGGNFISTYFKDLADFLGTSSTNTVAYRQQTNKMNENPHRELHSFLAIYLNQVDCTHWDTLLKLASWVHNTCYHEALETSPYEVVTGSKPNKANLWLPSGVEDASEKDIKRFLETWKEKLDDLRESAINAIRKGQAGFLQKQIGRK
jgi:hypothetical protein